MPSGRSNRGYVLREGEHSASVRPARMSTSLLESTYTAPGVTDPRLVDPLLEAVVERAAMEARARGFRAGHAAGYAAGTVEGRAMLAEQRRMLAELDDAERTRRQELLDGLVGRLKAAVRQALDVQQPLLEELYGLVATMSVELAEALVGHHLELDGCGAKDALLRAMAKVPREGRLVIRLHPADVELAAPFIAGVADWAGHQVVADESVERYGAVVTAQHMTIDAQYGAAFDRVREMVGLSCAP